MVGFKTKSARSSKRGGMKPLTAALIIAIAAVMIAALFLSPTLTGYTVLLGGRIIKLDQTVTEDTLIPLATPEEIIGLTMTGTYKGTGNATILLVGEETNLIAEFTAPQVDKTPTILLGKGGTTIELPINGTQNTTHSFVDECIDTCEGSYTGPFYIQVQVEGGELYLESITYSTTEAIAKEVIPEINETPPVNETNITINMTIPMNETNITINETLPTNETNITIPVNETNITINMTIPANETNLTVNVTPPINETNITIPLNETNVTTPINETPPINETNVTRINPPTECAADSDCGEEKMCVAGYCVTNTGHLNITDGEGKLVALFDKQGKILLAGSLVEDTTEEPPTNAFKIRNSITDIAWVTRTGDLHLKGKLHERAGSIPVEGQDNFILSNEIENVCVIQGSTGDLYTKSVLAEEVLI